MPKLAVSCKWNCEAFWTIFYMEQETYQYKGLSFTQGIHNSKRENTESRWQHQYVKKETSICAATPYPREQIQLLKWKKLWKTAPWFDLCHRIAKDYVVIKDELRNVRIQHLVFSFDKIPSPEMNKDQTTERCK